MSTIGPYQHCRHWPRRLWQIHHHWPLDLQGGFTNLVFVENFLLWWQNSAYYMISLIKLCFLIKYNVGRRLILENWFQIIHSDFSVEELTRGPSRCSRRKLRSLARNLFIFILIHSCTNVIMHIEDNCINMTSVVLGWQEQCSHLYNLTLNSMYSCWRRDLKYILFCCATLEREMLNIYF